MQVIKPYFEIEDIDGEEILKRIERAGALATRARSVLRTERKFVENIIKTAMNRLLS